LIHFRAHLLLLTIELLALHDCLIMIRIKVLGVLVHFLIVLVLCHVDILLPNRAEHLRLIFGTQLLGADT